MAEIKREVFSDLDMAFIAHPMTGNVGRKTNREAVKQSVKSLILTDYFERPFKSDIGCSIRYFLFENFSAVVKQQMERAILEVIENYEPRADVFEVLVEERPEMNALTISVAFYILNDLEPVILDVLLERVG